MTQSLAKNAQLRTGKRTQALLREARRQVAEDVGRMGYDMLFGNEKQRTAAMKNFVYKIAFPFGGVQVRKTIEGQFVGRKR